MTSNLLIKAGLRTTFATLTVASLAIPASATTITFENLDINPFTGPQVEGDFTYRVVSGSTSVIDSTRGNPASSLTLGLTQAPSVGDTIEFFLTDGGLFTFDSFDFASAGTASDTYNFFGEVNSTDTEQLLGINSNSLTFQTNSTPGFSAPIDVLRVEVGAATSSNAPLLLDNLVLTPADTESVPEPTSLIGLLLFGASGLALRRRNG
ncbi:MAG: PEP-CTERM sorting domain-containing protein [Microcystaceae cyanobacterium]